MSDASDGMAKGEAGDEARLFYTGAVGFLVAAEATHERHVFDPREPEHWPAISVNLCFAIELALKAFLARRGVTRPELKAIGHNLTRALSRSTECGLKVSHPAIPALVELLSPLHQNHSLRYLEDRSTELPEVRNMIAIARKLVLGLGAELPITDL